VEFGEGIEFHGREVGDALEKLPRKRGKKANKPETRKLTHLLFADDIVGCAHTREGLEAQLQSMSDAFRKHGLTINKKKTKWQKDDGGRKPEESSEKLREASATAAQNKKRRNKRNANAPEPAEGENEEQIVAEQKERVCIDGEEIERASEFAYLGAVFNEMDDDYGDLARRLQQGNKAIARIRKVLWSPRTPRRLKVKMIMTFAYPSVAYGCETWCLGKPTRTALDKWWMRQMRRARGVTKMDRLRNKTILEDLRASPLSELVEERQLRYLGHVWRYGDDRWTKFMLKAERPKQVKAGKQHQYRKLMTKLLKCKELTTGMMEDREVWRGALAELYPRGAVEEAQQDATVANHGDDGSRNY
jgi:hypothetical protein